MTEFPTITAIAPWFSLIAITGQLSYPLNSENASPFGTLNAYLSPAAKVIPLRTPTDATITAIVNILL